MQNKNILVHAHDPIVDPLVVRKEFKVKLIKKLNKKNFYDLIILAVPHKIFHLMGIKKIKLLGKKNVMIFDLKSVYPKEDTYWRL